MLYREATGQRETGIELHHLVKLKTPKLVVSLKKVNDTSLHIEECDDLMSATLDPYAAVRSAYFESHGNALEK